VYGLVLVVWNMSEGEKKGEISIGTRILAISYGVGGGKE
jgi:hypothetical protein